MALVGENGSHDGTRQLLEKAESLTGLVTVVDTSAMSKVVGRLHRMAFGRQMLADYARGMPVSTRSICVLDIDEPFLEHLDQESFTEALRRLDGGQFFAVAATSRPTYYDLLAFEDDNRSFWNLELQITSFQRNPLKYYLFFRNVIYREQRALTANFDILCLSAFNGLCLYLPEYYALGSYLQPGSSANICEHVIFNRSVAKASGKHMVIDGALVVPMPKEHGKRSLPGFLWQRTSKVARAVLSRFGPKDR
ncbi:conserved hypothetical protein [Arthrobacter sp. 8AJ]|nr:conserved hypothetical protein [Arthrobacter sp. 8AJ]